ncbi:MAG: LamG domain-containing protein, partial [Patescibacteria group bacterium]|nr:LamG domain-containing protein [Patescibacteria group bacterium]
TYSALYNDVVFSWDFSSASGNTVSDQSPNANDLDISGGAIIQNGTSPFPSGNSLYVNPTANKTAKSISAVKNPPSQSFSISFWVFPEGNGSTEFLSNGYSITPGTWRIGPHDGSNDVYFDLRVNGAVIPVLQSPPLSTSQWYQIVAVCQYVDSGSGIAGLYVNGSLVSGPVTFTNGPCRFAANRQILIGNTSNGSYAYLVDNVRVYDQALPLSFIKEQYLAEAPLFDGKSEVKLAKE